MENNSIKLQLSKSSQALEKQKQGLKQLEMEKAQIKAELEHLPEMEELRSQIESAKIMNQEQL